MPTKNKGPLTKVEKFYIENNKDFPTKKIAEDLGRSTKAVLKHLDSVEKERVGSVAKSKDETPDTNSAGELMSRNEKYGVTVMNESASMAGESSKGPKNNFNPNIMYKIKDD